MGGGKSVGHGVPPAPILEPFGVSKLSIHAVKHSGPSPVRWRQTVQKDIP